MALETDYGDSWDDEVESFIPKKKKYAVGQKEESAMNCHDQIMNLQDQIPPDIANSQSPENLAYRIGHHDARHAAAELVGLKADKIADLLRRIVASADKCDLDDKGVGVPLVSIDARLIQEAKELMK